MRCIFLVSVLLMLVFPCPTLGQQVEGLRAGCSVVDISPRILPAIRNGSFLEQTANRVDDALCARCLALASGSDFVGLAIVDSCMIPRDVCDEIKRRVEESTGLPRENLLIAATHTHTAPSLMDFCLGSRKDPNYAASFIQQVTQGMRGAVADMQPARIGWTVVDAPQHTYCRRWLRHPDHFGTDPFGERTVRAMMHPGYQNSEYIGPAGPVDSRLSLVSVQTAEGRPRCLLANYAMHYFGAENFSADYFGDFARLVESKFQQDSKNDNPQSFVAMMSQGTSGDQHWMDYSQPARGDYTRLQFATELADLAAKALSSIEYSSELPIKSMVSELKLKRRAPDEARLAWADKINQARGEFRPRNLPEVYAEQADWLARNPEATLLLQVVRIGELGIAAIPNEVFGITGLKLKAQSPLQPLVTFELANGAEGYIPPPEQHALGGYTTWPARTAGLKVEAEPKIVERLLSMLEEVSNQKRRPLTQDFYNSQQRAAIQQAGYDEAAATGR